MLHVHQVDFKTEMARYASFHSYPGGIAVLWPSRLAESGFYWSNDATPGLRCAFCTVEVEGSEFTGRRPMDVHKRHSPTCPLVIGRDCGNVSLNQLWQTTGRDFLHNMFHSPLRQPLDGPREANNRNEIAGKEETQNRSSEIQSFERQSGETLERRYLPELCGDQTRQQSHSELSPRSQTARPVTTSQTTPPVTTGQTNEPVTTSQTTPPVTTGQTTPPVTTGKTTPPVTTGPTTPPVTTSQTTPPVTTSQTTPPVTTSQTTPPVTTGQTTPPVTTSQTTPPVTTGQTTPPVTTSQTTHATENTPSHADHQRPCPTPQISTQSPANGRQHSTGNPSTTDQWETQENRPSPASSGNHTGGNSAPTETQGRVVVTYAQLGIFTQQPKMRHLAVMATRLHTFEGWPHRDTHAPEEMAEAGFYYTGHNDLVRCFYCRGGLQTWSTDLRPWVEHARFFQECPYVRQVKGDVFVEIVGTLHANQEKVSLADVENAMKRRRQTLVQQQPSLVFGTAVSVGGASAPVAGVSGLVVGTAVSVGGASAPVAGVSAPMGGTSVLVGGAAAASGDADHGLPRSIGQQELHTIMEGLQRSIQEAKEEVTCKICQQNEVKILFLPCGHLVSCAQCSPALTTCALCRQKVKGRVRVDMDGGEEWEWVGGGGGGD